LNTNYTYTVSHNLVNEAVFGKRVLIDFAGHKVDGYIVAETELIASAAMKTVLKVLDIEPVFDQSLLQLARWMADYYLCPLSIALSLMVPRILQHKKSQIILPAIDENEFIKLSKHGINLNRELFAQLWQQGELTISKALKYVNKEELTNLEERKYVARSGVYRIGREFKKGYYYTAGDFDYEKDLPALRRKAPRQAEIMELLREQSEIERDYLDALVSSASIKALLKKGYVIIGRSSKPAAEQ
jgi:primosomal protein N' (replication factor Y)